MLDGPVVVKDNALAGTAHGRTRSSAATTGARQTSESRAVRQCAIGLSKRRYHDMTHRSLEDKLQDAGSAVELARNSQIGRTSTRPCRPSSRTGGTSRPPGARRPRSSTSRTT